jgi:hypothetical protein
MLPDGSFIQKVQLLSDGTEMEIPFFDVFIRTLPLPGAGAKRKGA